MNQDIDIKKLDPIVKAIVKAIKKGCDEDTHVYLSTTNNATNNALKFMRADFINTNLRDSVASEVVELKYFKRRSWVGCLLIDRENKVTFTICSKSTLDSIPKKTDRKSPHFLQTLLHVQNSKVEVKNKQLSFFDVTPNLKTEFSDEDYKEDYVKIMGEDLIPEDEYLHLVIAYETSYFGIKSISMLVLDKDFQIATEYPLTRFLHPDFAELTRQEEIFQENDVHNLIKVKPVLGRKKRDSSNHGAIISAKRKKEQKQI
ncbi:MAG: DUF5986 family protein [Eubacteriales bacterium]|nr:DUF5986 family protein [Eubacteriales bacterium]